MTARTQLSVELMARVGAFEAGMRRAGNSAASAADRIKGTLGRVGPGLVSGLAAGAAAAGGALAFGLKGAIDRADQLAEASARLGLSTEAFSAMAYAASMSGMESSKLEASIRGFSMQIEKTEPLLNALGVATRDLSTKALLPSTDIIRGLGDTFARLPPGIEETQLAAELFGVRLGSQMIPLLNLGTQGIKDMEDRAWSLGGVLERVAARASEDFKDELNELKFVLDGALLDLIPQATDALRSFGALIKDPSFIDGIGSFAGVLLDTAQGFGLVASASNRFIDSKTAFRPDQSDAQLERRLAAVGTEIASARRIHGGQLPENLDVRMPWIARAMREREAIIREQTRRIKAAQKVPEPAVAPAASLLPPDIKKELERLEQARKSAEKEADRLRQANADATKTSRAAAAAERDRAKALAEADRASDLLRQGQAEFMVTLEDYRAQLAGPLAEAELAWDRRQKQLREQAKLYQISAADLADVLGLLAEARRREVDAIKAQLSPAQQVIADLDAELRLMKMSNVEREIANALRFAGADATAAERAEIVKNMRAIDEARQRIQFSDDIRRGFEDTFASIIDGSKSAREALQSLGGFITQLIAQRLSTQLVDSLFGPVGPALGTGGSGIGNFLGRALGTLFGGGRAAGGWVAPGKFYEVAENGPELLRMGNRQFLLPTATGGMVTPNSRLGGGGGVVQHISVQGSMTQRTAAQLAQEAARAQNRARARLGA